MVRHHRHKLRLTQEQLAERAGLSERGIQDLERGLVTPRRDTVERLVFALELLGEPRAAFDAAVQSAPRAREVPGRGRQTTAARTNLPRQMTSFVGREQALADIHDLLAVNRLLTLTGAGGVGKTRLALEVAATATERFRDGVWLVELAPIADPGHVAQTVAEALDIKERPGRHVNEALVAALESRELLLVLDNCEHLVAACAELAERLLRVCPNLRILTTSREALGASGEVRWLVPSLALPSLGSGRAVTSPGDATERLVTAEAVRLFVERARAAHSSFRVTDREAEAIAEVCRTVDGIPLAIELAAAWVRVLPVEQIAARLTHGSDLLISHARTVVPRQRTLRATIQWSYDLLEHPERELFEELCVFRGGWTLDAAEAVSGAPDTLARLARLVDQSLVLAEPDDSGGIRYRVLEPVRQFAEEGLETRRAAKRARDRHARYFLGLAEHAQVALWGVNQRGSWIPRLAREHDNMRAALRWLIDTGDAERAQLMGAYPCAALDVHLPRARSASVAVRTAGHAFWCDRDTPDASSPPGRRTGRGRLRPGRNGPADTLSGSTRRGA